MIDVHLSMDPKTRQSISSVAYIISYAETNSKAYNLTKSLIKEVFFLERGEGVQSDLENCAYLWKNLGYAPDPSTRSLYGSTLSFHKQTWRGNNRYWQRAQCDELRKLLRPLLNTRQWIHLALETEHTLTRESQSGRPSLNRRKIIIPKTSRIAWSRDLVSYQLRYCHTDVDVSYEASRKNLNIYLFFYQLFWTQTCPEGMCTNSTHVPCEVSSLPNPTTNKGWPHHRGLQPLLFSNSDVGSFASHKNKSEKVLWDGNYGFSSFSENARKCNHL